jgi:2-polyprenyl-3-methyl-5-hydroxy-6-metoxy-1,4-benzoquinol methylase
MTKACPCCEALRWEARWPGFAICGSCGLMVAEGDFALDDLKREYGAEYFHGREYVDYVADEPVQRKLLGAHLRRMARYVPPGARVLEVGCAYGYFLDLLRREYPGAVGVDVSADAVAAARSRGLDAREGDLLQVDIQGTFDAVCLWDTIEHLSAPEAVVRRGVDLLAPGGHVFLTTGDFGSQLARAQGLRWRQIHPPTHLFYFTRRALTRLCERLGLTVLTLETVTVHRRLSSSLRGWEKRYAGTRSARVAERLRLVLPAAIREFDFPLNLGDTVFLAARKQS